MNINLTIDFSKEDDALFCDMEKLLCEISNAYRALGSSIRAENIQRVIRSLELIKSGEPLD